MKNKTILFLVFLTPIFLFAQSSKTIKDYQALILSQATGLKAGDLSEIKLTSQSQDNSNGVTHIYFNQYYKSIPIHNAVLGLHLDKNGKVLHMNHTFFKNLESISTDVASQISEKDAANIALIEKNKTQNPSSISTALELISMADSKYIFKDAKLAQGDITVDKTWLMQGEKMILTWNVNWLTRDEQNWWNIRVNANSGKIEDENNWVVDCQAAHLDNHSSEPKPNFIPGEGIGEGKSSAKYNVLPRPIESPSHGDMALLNDPSDSLSSPFSWHDDNGAVGHEYTITRGNNVYASDDINNDNAPGYSPNGGSTLNFNFPFDKTKKHSDYLDAAITNLFYWNNLMHDVWYHYGFDDASGNFQANNYGRGGAGSDEVSADAQDGSGTNNANFATPPDGQNPRMQMYVWNVSSASLLLRVTQPSSIAKPYTSVLAAFGPKLTKTPITGNIVLVNDGTATPSLGCQALTNGTSINGQIALIDRGTCKFNEKVKFAQDKGAKAVIIINNVSGNPTTMSSDGSLTITIPAIMISKTDGDIIKNTLKTVTVKGSLYDSLATAGKQYDSDFDNGVISHEYGHGISNRLTGGASNTNCLTNQEQMGEGWSDFFALVMTHKPGDKGSDKHGIGTYVTDEANDGNGIRNYPYSTSLSINPVTYNDIKAFSVPHGVGSVWCSMLWDLYWDLIAKHGYDPNIYTGKGGNNTAMKLVIDGMKLQPCNPGFEDGRNAILLADRLNNSGANQDIIWKSFARRGLGYGASQGSNNSRTDGTESFVVPKFDLPTVSKTTLAEMRNRDTLAYKIVIKNTNPSSVYQITFKDTLATGLEFIKTIGYTKGTYSAPVYTANFDTIKAGDSIVFSIITRVNSAFSTHYVETTDFELGPGNWHDSALEGEGDWATRTNKKYKGARSFFVPNAEVKSDITLAKTFDLNYDNPYLVFYHWYNTESDWDGAVVEILKNGTWIDLGPQIIENGYNKTISTNPESNISGQKAFSGNSGKFIRSMIDLKAYKNLKTDIRFRFVSDAAQGGEGWYIDDITLVDNFYSITNSASVKATTGATSRSSVTTLILKEKEIGIALPKRLGFSVSPNPFNNYIDIFSNQIDYKFTLTDVMGRVIYQVNNAKNSMQLETIGLPSGTYFLKLETDMGCDVIKLIK